jgi:phosphoribosylformimino-5-aminoimidazole carboxamide ribotide isomerase
MYLYPAIDLYEGKAVRLYKGDYAQMTVYNDRPLEVAKAFESEGASFLHLVDLEGAKSGLTPNLETIKEIVNNTDLYTEVGGGIRSMATVKTYLEAGVDRVILGTAAVTDPDFVAKATAEYGERIAVGADIKDGKVAIKGWTETSDLTAEEFFAKMQSLGVRTVICTDVSKDGAMMGTNHELYRELSEKFDMQIVASGGVSSIEDVKKLASRGLYGAIIGKAYYTKAITIEQAIKVTR